jgi:hypothetical protein
MEADAGAGRCDGTGVGGSKRLSEVPMKLRACMLALVALCFAPAVPAKDNLSADNIANFWPA